MYVPKHFNEESLTKLAQYIQASSFATLVTSHSGTPYASHLPMHFDPNKGKFGTLYAHLARANEHWKHFQSAEDSLAIFTGINAYISPNWLQSVNAVPTWNYVAVHAYGRPQIIEDTDAVLELLANLSRANETEATGNWTADKMDQTVLLGMLKGIVAFEIPINNLQGKRKMSQNKNIDIQQSAIAGLRTTNEPQSAAVADDMETALNASS